MTGAKALVLVTTSYPLATEGSEAAGSFVADLAEEIARHVPVRVVAPGPRALCKTFSGLDVFRFPSPPKPLSTLRPWRVSELAAIVRVLRAGAAATQKAVAAGPTAHILALWALPSGHWARQAWRKTGVPYSVWALGSDIWTLGRIPIVRTHLARVLQDAQVRYADGLQLADATRRIGGREVEFLPSTRRIERKRIVPLKEAPPYRLLFLGRWHPNKGVDLLLQALRLLSHADWQRISAVEICGGGPLEAQVRAGVEALRACGRPVELRGFLGKTAAEEAILSADYLLIPSRLESIPLVFSDAMKLGCPVVSMPAGDLSDLLTCCPSCGVVATDVSGGAFAAAISQALQLSPSVFAEGLAVRTRDFDLSASVRRLLASGHSHVV